MGSLATAVMQPTTTTMLIVVFIATCVYVLGQSPECRQERLDECQDLLNSRLKDNEFLKAHTTEDLARACTEMNFVLSCIDNYQRDCIDSVNHQQELLQTYSGIRVYLDDLCSENSQLAKEYLQHAPCMAKVQPMVEACIDRTLHPIQELWKSSNGLLSKSDVMLLTCCGMTQMYKCSEDSYGEHCGPDVKRLARQSLAIMFQPLEARCASVDKYQCSSASSLKFSMMMVALVDFLWLLLSL